MLFKNINSALEKDEKKFFLEKIYIIIELIKKYCIKNRIDFKNISIDDEKVFHELQEMGIVSVYEQLDILKKILQKDFIDFGRSLSFYHDNKKETNHFLNKFYNSYRLKVQEENKKTDKPTIIDLFCGAGGFSLGFLKEGYKIELANDIEPVAVETYKFNHPDIPSDKIICGDIKKIVDNIDDHIDCPIDIIIGGPPCQSFSSANQQRVIDDPRNVLYKYFVEAVNVIRPKFILMENVRGMMKVAPQVKEDFRKIGYDVEYKIYNSHDFSVPQKRERLIYVGINNEYRDSAKITPQMIMNDVEELLSKKKKFVLSAALEHIKPLSCAKIKNLTEDDCEESGKKIDLNEYTNQSNDYLDLINSNQRFDFVFNHKARFNSENDQEIYSRLKQGKDSTCESIKDIMPYAHRNHVFKDKYFKLIENNPSRTITAHMKMDCHSHIHPHQIRSLTPREAARVQSFPDDYLFMGPYLKTYMQIGNAVPPLMTQVFAKVFQKYL